MTRFGYVMTTYAVTMGIAIAAFVPIAPRLVGNASASAPIGLYDLAPPHPLTVGDLSPPSRQAALTSSSGAAISAATCR